MPWWHRRRQQHHRPSGFGRGKKAGPSGRSTQRPKRLLRVESVSPPPAASPRQEAAVSPPGPPTEVSAALKMDESFKRKIERACSAQNDRRRRQLQLLSLDRHGMKSDLRRKRSRKEMKGEPEDSTRRRFPMSPVKPRGGKRPTCPCLPRPLWGPVPWTGRLPSLLCPIYLVYGKSLPSMASVPMLWLVFLRSSSRPRFIPSLPCPFRRRGGQSTRRLKIYGRSFASRHHSSPRSRMLRLIVIRRIHPSAPSPSAPIPIHATFLADTDCSTPRSYDACATWPGSRTMR